MHYELQLALARRLAKANRELGKALHAVLAACEKDDSDLRSYGDAIDAANEAHNPKPINELALRLDRCVMEHYQEEACDA